MTDEVVRLGAGDYDELLTHLARVFREPVDRGFDSFLGGIYGPGDERMRWNLAVRRQGRIAAVVGVFPIRWRVGGDVLPVAGIGGVSVAPEHRRSGLMKLLMRHAIDEMGRDGTALSFLSGQRQRYAYFGYEVAGCRLDYSINAANIRHACGDTPCALTAHVPTDNDLAAAFALFEAQPHRCERSRERFPAFLRHWWMRPLSLRRDGRVVGYAVVGQGDGVTELVLTDAGDAVDAVRALMAFLHRDSLRIEVQPTLPELGAALGRVAEHVTVATSGNWRVFDWPRVVTALLRAKAGATALLDGEATLGVGDETLALSVHGGRVACERTRGPAMLRLDPLTATRLLMGPVEPRLVAPLPPDATALSSWCPLPLSFSRQDHV